MAQKKKAATPAEAAESVLADESKKDDEKASNARVATKSEQRGRRKRGKFWHPSDFKGDPDAARINGAIDKFDPQTPGAASKNEVGESVLATAAEIGKLDIHPGWYVLINGGICAATIISHRMDAAQKKRESEGPKGSPGAAKPSYGFAGLVR